MKLLLLTPEYQGFGGGIITLYRTILPALRDLGVEVHVLEGSGMHALTDPSPRVEDGIRLDTLDSRRLARWHQQFVAFAATPSLRRHMAAAWAMWEQAGFGEGYDIVEACDFGLMFIPPAIDAKCPLVVQCHGSIGQIAVHDPLKGGETEGVLVRLIERAVLQHAQCVQTFSTANASFWQSETGREVTSLLPALAPPPRRSVDPSDRGLVVGRVQRWKGPHVLCEAMRRLGAGAPHVDWIGGDTLWDSTDQSSTGYLKSAYPEIWGTGILHSPPIPSGDVALRQAAARFNLVPSSWDVFNFTAAEAMASGRPAIVSNGAGASELIETGRNGFVFEADDPRSLASVIEEVLGQPDDRLSAIGAAGRESVLSELEPRSVAEKRILAYQAEIEAFRSRPAPAVSDWLQDICRPALPGNATSFSFLERLPLRALLAHVATRLGTNLRRSSPFPFRQS